MKNKKYEIFCFVSTAIIGMYAVCNLIAIALAFCIWDKLLISDLISDLFGLAVGLDVFTWHIFSVLCIITFIIKAVYIIKHRKKSYVLTGNAMLLNKKYTADIILHIIFSLISIGCIVFIFSNCF